MGLTAVMSARTITLMRLIDRPGYGGVDRSNACAGGPGQDHIWV